MADYSGATSGDITIQDGDTTGSAGTLSISAGDTCTVEAGATVSSYQSTWVFVSGTLVCVGTEDSPIIWRPQAADPAILNGWEGLRVGDDNAEMNVKYTILQGSDYIWIDHVGVTLDIQQLIMDNSNRISIITTQNHDNDIKKIYSKGPNAIAVDNNHNSGLLNTSWCWFTGSGSAGICFDMDEANGSGTHQIDNIVSVNRDRIFQVEDATAIEATQCYFSYGDYPYYVQEASSDLDISDSVFYKFFYYGTSLNSATVDSSYNDYISSYQEAYLQVSATLNSDYDYVAGCNRKPSYVVDQTYDTQVGAYTTRTNQQANPVHPLEVDNISEGTPDQNGITITYDCKAGTAGSKRLTGLPFIKYGTTSGTYDMQTKLPPPEDYPLYWIGWKTDMEWKQTGHSVTLTNLKPGTTYYYKACFVDPFGRLAESEEGDFTTTSSGGGGGEHSYGCV